MKIDRVHFYTRNAAGIKNWFVQNIGFKSVSTEINRHTHTELVALNFAYFAISSPLNSASPVARYLQRHPEGVADITFKVRNLEQIVDRARSLGLKVIEGVQIQHSEQGDYKSAKILGWGDLIHTLIETDEGDWQSQSDREESIAPSNITQIDHVVLNVAQGKLKSAVELYRKLFNFQVQQSFEIQTSISGLTSEALIDETGKVQFNINQPTTSNSQIQEFIDRNGGSGIQHLALRSQNLIADVAWMQQQALKFLAVTPVYYRNLDTALTLTQSEREALERLQILADGEGGSGRSLLLQIFTEPILEQPTFFLEFIERRYSAKGFGKGNFQALFEAVERNDKKHSKHRHPIQ